MTNTEAAETKFAILGMRPFPVSMVLATLVLAGAAGWSIKLRYDRHMTLLRNALQPPYVSFDWKGPEWNWLTRRLGEPGAVALLQRPSGVSAQLEHHTADDVFLKSIRDLRDLEAVSVHNGPFPEGALETLAVRHRVQRMAFQCAGVSPDDAAWLSRMTALESVHLDVIHPVRRSDWSWLKSLPRLKSLGVTLNDARFVDDGDVHALAECPAVFRISLQCRDVSSESLGRLLALPALESLFVMGDFQLTLPPGARFPPTLTYLDLSSDQIDDDLLAAACDLPVLEYFHVRGARLGLHLPNGTKLPASVRQVILHCPRLDDASLDALDGLPKLNVVILEAGRITDAGLARLARLPSVHRIDLHDIDGVTEAGIGSLIHAKKLTQLVLGKRPEPESPGDHDPAREVEIPEQTVRILHALAPLLQRTEMDHVTLRGVHLGPDASGSRAALTKDRIVEHYRSQIHADQ